MPHLIRVNLFTCPSLQGMCVGGNLMHLAPEVLNEHERLRRAGPGAKGFLCYRQQEVWAVGVLIHSMIFASHPWPDYPNDCGGVGNIHYNLAKEDATRAQGGMRGGLGGARCLVPSAPLSILSPFPNLQTPLTLTTRFATPNPHLPAVVLHCGVHLCAGPPVQGSGTR